MSKYILSNMNLHTFCKSDYKAVGLDRYDTTLDYSDSSVQHLLEQGYKQLEDNANFLDELMVLYTKYNVSISHEDGHGGFIIESDCDYNEEWIKDAVIEL